MDAEILGTRYTCFTCGTKFYDLNRPDALCPECGADQAEAPIRDFRDIVRAGKRRKKQQEAEEAEEAASLASDIADSDGDGDGDGDDVDDLFDDDEEYSVGDEDE